MTRTVSIAGPIVTQLESIYSRLCAEHPDLPTDVVIIIGDGTERTGVKYGHADNGSLWTHKPTPRSKARPAYEILISAQALAVGAGQAFQTLVHETVHLYCRAKDIRETTRQGRWHNRRFVEAAELFGMHYPHDGPSPKNGYSAVEPTPELAKAYRAETKELEKVITAAGITFTPPPRKPRRVAVVTMDDGAEFELGVKTYQKVSAHLQPHEMFEEER